MADWEIFIFSAALAKLSVLATARKQDDIRARFQNGVLRIFIPKKQQPALEEKNMLTIAD